MLDLILVMAKHLPKDKLAEELRKGCVGYIKDPTEINWQKVIAFSAIVLGKGAIEEKSIMQVLKEQEEVERITERMNSKS